jgi:aminomethyltransferase
MESTAVKQTPFYDKHVTLGAKVLPFAGYLMPIQYSGIIDEHLAVRNKVGIFDVSHMGEFIVRGPQAEKFLNRLTVNDVVRLDVGQVQYSAMCYPDGGIVDDLLVYKFADRFMMVVNASNIAKDFDWTKQNLIEGAEIEDISDKTALLAIQGPEVFHTLMPLTKVPLQNIPFYHFREGRLADIEMIISRTGYTGEKGFELYHTPQNSARLWDAIMESGKSYEIQPVGLGARDTLRLEMKYALYGNDIDQTTNPLEAGLAWITKLDKGDFIGRDVLLKVKAEGVSRRNVAFEMIDRGIPRHGYKVFEGTHEVGEVTSGTLSPVLNKGIGTAYVNSEFSAVGTELVLDIRGKMLKMKIIKPPFVTSHTL